MSVTYPIRALLMEDDIGQARLAQRRLERAGYAVDWAKDGDEGLARYQPGAYDVLLIDRQMPGQDGLDVLRALTTLGSLPPTIMVTGNGDEEVAVEAMKLGAGDYIVKDVEGRYLTLLPTVIERLLAQQQLAKEKRQAEEALHQTLEELEQRVRERTADLERMNAQLQTEMEERQRIEHELRRADRLTLVGQLTSGLAHEIGTPLNVIAGNAELLRQDLAQQGIPTDTLASIVGQADRITGLIQKLLNFARAKEEGMSALHLHTPLSNALRLLETRFRHEAIQIAVEVPADLPPIWGDSDQIEQIFLNVLVNAWHAMPEGGTVQIQAGTADDGQRVWMTIRDSGVGLSPTDLERAFEPFYTTKKDKGTGLGLAMCRQIMDSHRGAIEIDSTLGKGATLTMTFLAAEVSA